MEEMIMTLRQFKFLSPTDQSEVLKRKAVLIGFIDGFDGVCFLFQLDGFYFEVYCSTAKVCKVEGISFFDNMDFLGPYLEAVNIDQVYEVLNC